MIAGQTVGAGVMNRSFAEMTKGKSSDLLTSSFNETIVGAKEDVKIALVSKTIYHKAIDSFQLTDYYRGFLKDGSYSDAVNSVPVFGVYCVRWRRTGCAEENETKVIVHGVGKFAFSFCIELDRLTFSIFFLYRNYWVTVKYSLLPGR